MPDDTESVQTAMVNASRLAGYTADELLEEIDRRFDTFLFVGQVLLEDRQILRTRHQYSKSVKDALELISFFLREHT